MDINRQYAPAIDELESDFKEAIRRNSAKIENILAFLGESIERLHSQRTINTINNGNSQIFRDIKNDLNRMFELIKEMRYHSNISSLLLVL